MINSRYWRRFLISLAVVGSVSVIILIRSTLNSAIGALWFWPWVVIEQFGWGRELEVHAAIMAIAALCILAIAARRRTTSILVTAWFVANTLGGIWFLLAMQRSGGHT